MREKTFCDSYGYLRFTDSGRLVHRWKAEKKIGRRLRPNEVVHHKNGIKTDNRFCNLIVYSSTLKHRARHSKKAWQKARRPRSLKN